MVELTRAAALDYFPPYGSHTEPYYNLRLEHVKQVEIEALKLLEVYEADRDVVLASVWVHDRYKPQFDGDDHGNKAADWVIENLAGKGFPEDKVKAVKYAVRNHVGYNKRELDTIEAKIVWDADKLSHIGPCYFFQTLFIFTNEGFCKMNERDGVRYSPTISIENVFPALLGMKGEIDYDMPFPFHLEESTRLYFEKREAVNSFVGAMQKQL